MQRRRFGSTSLEVSAVGLGAGSIGDEQVSDADVDQLVSAALAAFKAFLSRKK